MKIIPRCIVRIVPDDVPGGGMYIPCVTELFDTVATYLSRDKWYRVLPLKHYADSESWAVHNPK